MITQIKVTQEAPFMMMNANVQGPPYILERYISSPVACNLNFPALLGGAADGPHP